MLSRALLHFLFLTGAKAAWPTSYDVTHIAPDWIDPSDWRTVALRNPPAAAEIVEYRMDVLRAVPPDVIKRYTTSSSRGTAGVFSHSVSPSNETRVAGDAGHPVDLKTRDVLNGKDDRVLFSDMNWPFRAIGKWVWTKDADRRAGFGCTATLIGPRHLLTARYCVDDIWSGLFMPGYDEGERFPRAWATKIIVSDRSQLVSSCYRKQEWAIVILNRRVGDEVGYIGTLRNQVQEKFRTLGTLTTLGYHLDTDKDCERPYRETGITGVLAQIYLCDAAGPVRCYADVSIGAAGSPIWERDENSEERWILGTASFRSKLDTEYASGNEMLAAIAIARRDWP
ncbi:uncharacterized protein B0I36DRAFT_385193 [Microdochium trichocladiopsis]|uniref:Peptidase S1 domain-containing protein n=1 Tax=Microdochium trichocladiopsis TaxID=1682393 RepID=A0A9P9BQ48_9PEZI|nr:uncharacterized protein B0I36DRAFT_385193 [Microdochium trichocladiopsis]KAH7029845.1 hypothetical protein B0I36DRAFT_385193 [Microdochium trichocladiopsis]